MSGHILVVGSINMDMVVRTERHPQPGETLLGQDFRTYPGGKGANQAVAAARAGGRVKMIARLGQDAFGDRLEAGLKDNGVDTTCVIRTPDVASGVALITLDADGQNTIVVAAGANSRLAPADLRDFESVFEGAALLVLQLETPLETVAKAIAMATQFGVKVLLNPAPAQSLPGSLLSRVDYLIPNESELGLLTGIQSVGMATAALHDLGTGAVVVTLGSRGVYLSQGTRHINLPAHTVTVVDTVAAGDAFVGAFAVAISEGKPLEEAAEWGNAAGALAVTCAGAQPSLPTREEIERFLVERRPTPKQR
jgi:ribokinase